jgi:hypothetical protein
MERYVYVLNSDKYGNANVDYTFEHKGNAFRNNIAFKNTSVTPVIKCTNITAEHNGTSANFFEIRNTHYDGEISNDSKTAIVNRVYPSTNVPNLVTDATYAQNRQQTSSFKIRTYSTKSATNSSSHANQLLIGNSSINIDLDTNDYFVLINPQISHSTADTHPTLRPHFAKITNIVSFDEFGDGFEFEPKYPETIARHTNFEIYKGPLVSDTSVIAVSYGLRGDGTELGTATTDDYNQSNPITFITDKYDAGSEVSKPTWYFYNNRLQNKDQLDYSTKYNLTTCRAFNWTTKGSYYNTSADAIYTTATINSTAGSALQLGQSIYSNNKTYMGNVTAFTSSTVTLDYARNTIASLTEGNSELLYIGRTVHQSVFRTEKEYGNIIEDYGTLNQDAVLVDKMYDKDGEIGSTNSPQDYETTGTYTFDPAKWKDAFRNNKRHVNDKSSAHTSYSTSATSNARHADLTGPTRYLYYKQSHKKNNAVNPLLEISVNNPKNKISQFASVKVLDNNGIQFLKLKEDEKYVVSSSLHTSNTSDIKLPYTGTSLFTSIGTTFSIVLNNVNETVELDWKPTVDYGVNQVIKPGTILKVKDIYYRVSSISETAELIRNQTINISAKKEAKDKTWTILTASSQLPSFTAADVYITAWSGGLNTKSPIDTEVIYENNVLQRLLINENTISKQNNSLYKKKLVLLNQEFYGYNIEIDYGDKNHNHIKLLTAKTLYQPINEQAHFMYYYQGGYCIEEDVFIGTVEDIVSKNENGLITYTISGRDNTGILLNNTTNKNLHKTDDIIYSTMSPIFDTSTSLTRVGNVSNNVLTVSGIHLVKKYDLILNANGELIGEVASATGDPNTIITLVGVTDNVTTTGTFIWVKLTDSNYLTGTKALAANIKLSKHPTDFSSIGNGGLIFNDGEEITYGSSFAYSKLLNTSATGSYHNDNTIGYDITDIKSISESIDSAFALKTSIENQASIDYKTIQTVSSMHFNVLNINSSSTENTNITLAPSFPIVLGSIDTNTSDTNGYGSDLRYLYMVNSNIPSGGFIHTLKNSASDYYTPDSTFRYWGMQKFTEGSIKETHDSIYDNSKKTQRITAAMPMYKINALGVKSSATSDLTPTLTPVTGSNLWTGSEIGLSSGLAAPIELWDLGLYTKNWNQLENIDYRAKNYELLTIGDIYPDSKLRWNNLQFVNKEMNTYGMVLKSDGAEGDIVSHQNFTGTNTQTNLSDSNYERIEINDSNKTTSQLKRFGIMRLVEATFDWHMNPIDYESVAGNDNYDKITNFSYPRAKLKTQGTINSYNNTDNKAYLSNAITVSLYDIVYNKDGKIIAQIYGGGAGSKNYIAKGDFLTVANPSPYWDDGEIGDAGGIYILNQKTFELYSDTGFGINTLGRNDIRMLNTYIMCPGIEKDYFGYHILNDGTVYFDPQSIFIPIISESIAESGANAIEDFDSYYSLFHQAKHWDASTTEPIWYHPSKIIYALAFPTTRDASPGTALVEDGKQFKISNSAHLYGNSTILFKNMKTTFQQDEKAFTLPTSATLSDGGYGSMTNWINYVQGLNDNNKTDQRALNVSMISDWNAATTGDKATEKYWSVCGVKTPRYIYAADGNRDWDRAQVHGASDAGHTGNNQGAGFQAQAFIKPKLTFSGYSNIGTSHTFTLSDSSINNWLDFVPNLTGYYLVSDRITPITANTANGDYLPHDYDITTHTHYESGEPVYIGKILSHSINTSGTYKIHTLTFDKTINTLTTGLGFRLMRISETTFENTPDYFEVNKMFDTGLNYESNTQNYVTGEEMESGSDLNYQDAGATAVENHLSYQEGLYSMYLLLDVDNFNTYIDRRTLADAKLSFTDGESLNCYITDGNNKSETNLIVSKTSNGLRFSYNGELTGYGVVSFGETFTIESASTPNIRNANEAFIGTTVSIGTDAELAMMEILEENDLEVDSSLKNIIYTGNIVDSNTTGTTITLTVSHSNVVLGDIIYNQDGRLIGKVTTANTGTSLVISNIFYKPKKNDEITKYERKPFILNTNFNEQDIFSSINYLAGKRQLDYSFQNEKIIIREDNFH